jgi:hypothetical protein
MVPSPTSESPPSTVTTTMTEIDCAAFIAPVPMPMTTAMSAIARPLAKMAG